MKLVASMGITAMEETLGGEIALICYLEKWENVKDGPRGYGSIYMHHVANGPAHICKRGASALGQEERARKKNNPN